MNRDRYTDIIAGAGTGNGSTVSSFSGQSLTQIGVAKSRFAVDAFPERFNGVNVG